MLVEWNLSSEVGNYIRTKKKRRRIDLKFMSIMSWKPENAQKVTELFAKWEIPKGLKFLYPPCTVLGGDKSVSIFETTDEAWAKVDRYWRHTCTIETYPLMESSEIAKIK